MANVRTTEDPYADLDIPGDVATRFTDELLYEELFNIVKTGKNETTRANIIMKILDKRQKLAAASSSSAESADIPPDVLRKEVVAMLKDSNMQSYLQMDITLREVLDGTPRGESQ